MKLLQRRLQLDDRALSDFKSKIEKENIRGIIYAGTFD